MKSLYAQWKPCCLAALLAAILLAIHGCSVNPVTGKNELTYLDESWEIKTGETYYPYQQQAGGGQYVIDPDLSRYVHNVGMRIVRHSKRSHLPYDFVVLNDSTPNAWALPGGKIAINRGLMVELADEAELAAVLAHEIVHSAGRHSAQSQEVGTLLSAGTLAATVLLDNSESLSGSSGGLVKQGIAYGGLYGQQRYSRSRESEADLYGMRYMSAAGYDPKAAVDLQKTFVRLSGGSKQDLFSSLFASHPPSQQRVDENIKTAATLPAGGERGVERYRAEMSKLKKRQPAYELADKAQQAIADGNYKQAVTYANQAIDIESGESLFHEVKGAALAELNRSRDALSAFDRAVALNPGYYAPVLRRGLLRYDLKSMQSAETDFKASLALAPTQIAYIRLGEIAEQQLDCKSASNYYQQATRQSDANRENLEKKLLALQSSCQ